MGEKTPLYWKFFRWVSSKKINKRFQTALIQGYQNYARIYLDEYK